MFDERNETMMDYGLNPDEARELQAQLGADEWDALLQVQRQLLDTPAAVPSAGFADRVLLQAALRERRQAWRRSALGAAAFALGTLLVVGLAMWSSPLGLLVQAGGWAGLLDSALSALGFASTLLIIGQTFAAALFQVTGSAGLLLFALFALALTLVWTQVVAGRTPLNRFYLA